MFRRWTIPVLVAAVALVAFSPALDHQFLNWDDNKNIVDNPYIRGFGAENWRWMFTAVHLGHYHPLTWVSYAVDYAIWGWEPRGFHLTNLLLHAANAVLLYWVAMRLLGGRAWAAALAALVFAVHPLRVESVAWVSERRDVLSGFFYLLAVLAYLRAVQEGPRRRWLGVSLAAFAAALLSKVIVVSLPVVLVALDFYPLRRRAWGEKIPYVVLAGAGAMAALALQPLGVGGFAGHVTVQGGLRLGLSLYGLAFYLWKTLVPVGLYPQYVMAPEILPWDWRLVLSGLVVAVLTAGAILLRRRWPAAVPVAVCYAASLAPVLSLVRVDPQQYVADHHTYLASLGLALVAGAALASRPMAGVLVVAFLAALSWRQTGFWRDSLTLWQHAVEGAPYSGTAHNNLGEALAAASRLPEAATQFGLAIELQPRHANAYYNLGQALERQGQTEAAATEFQRALKLEPALAAAHNSLANCYASLGRPDAAIEHYHLALRYQPDFADAHYNLGNLLQSRREVDQAMVHYREALRSNPALADAHNNFGVALDSLGKGAEAMEHYRRALEIDPRHADAHNNLGLSLEAVGRREEAVGHYREALRWNPGHTGAAANLARQNMSRE